MLYLPIIGPRATSASVTTSWRSPMMTTCGRAAWIASGDCGCPCTNVVFILLFSYLVGLPSMTTRRKASRAILFLPAKWLKEGPEPLLSSSFSVYEQWFFLDHLMLISVAGLDEMSIAIE